MKLRLKSCTLAHDGTGELKEGLIFNPFKKSPTSRPSRYSQRELAVKSSCAVIIRHAPAPNSPLRLELKNFSSGLDWLGSSSYHTPAAEWWTINKHIATMTEFDNNTNARTFTSLCLCPSQSLLYLLSIFSLSNYLDWYLSTVAVQSQDECCWLFQ